MGNMAQEIQRRMAEDGIDPSTRVAPGEPSDGTFGGEPSPDGAAAPGSARDDLTPDPQPAAEPSTTDTEGRGEPGPIPYARFREVNERYQQLKDYEQLAAVGYDPASLGRLAAFEAQYVRDPTGTVATLIDDLDLSEEAKETMKQQLQTSSAPAGAGNEEEGQVPAGLSPEDAETLKWAREERQRRAQEQETASRQAVLDEVTGKWTAQDKSDNIKGPNERMRMQYISTALGMGQYQNAEQLAKAARDLWLEDRDEILGNAVRRGRNGAPPATLSGGVASSGPIQAKTLKEASARARADIEAGRLPDFSGG